MFRIFRDQLTQDDINAGADQVWAWAQIPGGGRLNNFWSEVHLMGAGFLGAQNAVVYGVQGLVVDEYDTTANHNANTVWDVMVPKDIDMASGVIDYDESNVNTVNFFEPGEPNPNDLFDLNDTRRFFKRTGLVTIAKTPRMSDPTTTPGDFLPTDFFKVKSGKRINCVDDSWAMMALSSPLIDDKTSTTELWGDTDWAMLKYIKKVIEAAFYHALGITTTESPFDDAALLLEQYTEPTVYESNAGAFQVATWRVFANSTWDISVPGEIAMSGQISAG